MKGDTFKLDEIVSRKSVNVLVFRNAFLYLVTKEGLLGFKISLRDEKI